MIETVLEYLLILWALPSLVTMLLVIRTARKDRHGSQEPSDYDLEDWGICIALSVLYPIGLWFVFVEYLTKPINKDPFE